MQESGRLTVLTDPTQHTPDAANGNSFDNSSQRVIIYVTNNNVGSVTLTVDIPGTFEGEELPNKTYTLLTGTRTVIGPFSSTYNQTDNSLANRVLLDWSTATDVLIEVIKVPQA